MILIILQSQKFFNEILPLRNIINSLLITQKVVESFWHFVVWGISHWHHHHHHHQLFLWRPSTSAQESLTTQTTDWEFVIYVFNIRKNSQIFRNFYISKIRFIASVLTSDCKVFEFAQQLAVVYIQATVEWEQCTAILTQGKTVKLQAICRLCNIHFYFTNNKW